MSPEKTFLDVSEETLNDVKTDDPDTRRTSVGTVRMPGMNPAQATLSREVDLLWKRVMVEQLGKALQQKLREFAE